MCFMTTPIPGTYRLRLGIWMFLFGKCRRRIIETKWRRFKEIDYVLNFVKSEIDKGHSAYIVAPLIEESETLD